MISSGFAVRGRIVECIEAVVLVGSLNKDYECRLNVPDSPMANRSSGGTSAKTTFT
jgi:hypothetical protein